MGLEVDSHELDLFLEDLGGPLALISEPQPQHQPMDGPSSTPAPSMSVREAFPQTLVLARLFLFFVLQIAREDTAYIHLVPGAPRFTAYCTSPLVNPPAPHT